MGMCNDFLNKAIFDNGNLVDRNRILKKENHELGVTNRNLRLVLNGYEKKTMLEEIELDDHIYKAEKITLENEELKARILELEIICGNKNKEKSDIQKIIEETYMRHA